ncbi:MAG TPA: PEP-utilizing enzyme [Gaiellaceae bacterium]|nr:PEP-utilizing enzyme [Gaiellaceae bacterium]
MTRTWLPDPSHYPEQMTPLSATTWFEAMGRGVHAAARELRAPFGGFETRLELGWAYEAELEPDWDVDRSVLEGTVLELAERWERQLRPRVLEINAELEKMRPDRGTSAEAVQMLDRLWELVQEEWAIHFLVVLPALTAAERADPEQLLGIENPADDAVWHLADLARREAVDDLIRDFTPAAALARLRATVPGRRFLRGLAAYLERYGGRARWHELSLPREAEQPTMTLEAVRLALELGERPVRAPAPAGVDDRLRAAYALKELHTYDIDYPGLLATREALLGFGRRLVGEGLLDAAGDVWMLERDELRSALTGTSDLRALVAERREEQARGLAEGVRSFLGEPPAEHTRDTVVESFYGSGGTALNGAGASPGVAEGVARVVADASDFARIQSGDILVTTMTTPAWTPLFPSLAGLVTETGGILSHAAVVAREYGLPAVVGAAGAVSAIPDGKRVRIDGTSGAISLL